MIYRNPTVRAILLDADRRLIVGHSQLRMLGSTPALHFEKTAPRFKATETKSEKSQREANNNDLRHFLRFFAEYPSFKYDPTKPYTEEFKRMMLQFKWTKQSQEYRQARKRLYDASVRQFNRNFDNKKEKDLQKWIALFNNIELYGTDPLPKTVGGYKERVQSVHVNICDLLETRITKKKAKDWGNEISLSEYTKETEKYFPRKHVLAGDILNHLLRHIMDPSASRGLDNN